MRSVPRASDPPRRWVVVVILLLLAGQAAAQSPASALEGVWEGTMTNRQIGQCGWSAGPEHVRIAMRLAEDGKPAGWLAPLSAVPPTGTPKDNLKIKITGDKLRIEHARIAICGTTFKRNYSARLEGPLPTVVDGKRVLVLDGLDVPCIQSGCRFGVSVSAEWTGPLP
jgi:hypothetical protein